MTLTAIILASPSPLSAGLASCWLNAGHTIGAIWCGRQNRKAARHDRLLGWAAPTLSLASVARRAKAPVQMIGDASDWIEAMEKADRLNPDVVLSLMFMRRIPADVIAAFPGKIVNLHPALLPAFGGPDPMTAMLFNEQIGACSGMTLHEVAEELDAGAIIDQRPTGWPANGDIVAYNAERIRTGAELITLSLPLYLRGELRAVSQDSSRRHYCSITRSGIRLRAQDTSARVRWLCGTIGRYSALRLEGAPENVRITGFLRRLGDRSGRPLRIRRSSVEMDVADGRLLLARETRLSSLAARAGRLWRYTCLARQRSFPASGNSADRRQRVQLANLS
jgi:folate-dependent phosphoribosylglycinamide formyltransferase PurN